VQIISLRLEKSIKIVNLGLKNILTAKKAGILNPKPALLYHLLSTISNNVRPITYKFLIFNPMLNLG